MSTHALLSPSRRHRWRRCAGSIREEEKYPDKFSATAADGTHSHSLLERCVIQDLDDPMRWIGVKIVDHEGEFTVDAERAKRVKVAVDYVTETRARLVRDRMSLMMAHMRSSTLPFSAPPVTVIAEQHVDPESLVGRSDMSGTVDVQIHGPGIVEIIDYKDGMGQVDAFENDQLEQYALGVIASGAYPQETVIRMTIVQPKLAVKGQPVITSHDTTVGEMLTRVPQIIKEAAATDDPNAPLNPGDIQCKFCRAKGGCAALADNVMKEVGVMFPKVNEMLDVAQQSADKDPATMSDDQIRQIIEAAPLMRQMLESVEDEALRRMKSGVRIPGLKLVNGRGARAWNLDDDQIAEKLVKLGIPKGSVYETKLVSPAKVEKLTWSNRKGESKQLSDRQLKTIEQEYVTKMAGKLTVALESDSRAAVIVDASSMFTAVQSDVPPAAPAIDSMPSWLS